MLFQRARGPPELPVPPSQNSNPAQDLERVPPGLLALDNMLYFSRHAPSAYSRVSDGLWGKIAGRPPGQVSMGFVVTPLILCSHHPVCAGEQQP